MIRDELLSGDRLEGHAETVAAAHSVTSARTRGNPLAERLRANEGAMAEAYDLVARQAAEGAPISPAAEWFVDNYFVVEEQFRSTRRDLPPRYYEQLPKLAGGPFEGLPRVYAIAWEFVAHTDSRFDLALLERFVSAYQRVHPLEIGELWALAITLRIVLLENLRRAADKLVLATSERSQADLAAERLLGNDEREPEAIESVMRPFTNAPLSPAFTVRLVRRLHDLDPDLTPARRWLETRLAAQGTTPEALVQDDHYRQATMNVTVGNIVTSMRHVSQVDWSATVERLSLVDALFRSRSDFAAMDFDTRDRYRQAVEVLARGSDRSELAVAERALAAAHAADRSTAASSAAVDERRHDPGYFLVGGGRPAFEAELGYVERRPHRRGRLPRITFQGYLTLIAALSAAVLALPILALGLLDVPSGLLLVLAVLAVLPASDVAIVLFNYAATTRDDTAALPGLELESGVPPHLRTLLVVPSMLSDEATLARQLQRLETHFLANRDDELRFALLTDWEDAPVEATDADATLHRAAAAGIARLNRQYGPAGGDDRFWLLHRRREWSPTQRAWIGWERKRGKLHELNRLLRGDDGTSFIDVDGEPPRAPQGVRYVITLDDDTRTPRGTARRLIGKMAHPLNRPRLDEVSGRVVEGYAVLQPRVTLALPTDGEGTFFQRVFSGTLGIDPYVSAVSDVYQDLFGEGSYTGKGIYEIDAFERALAGRVPEETLLSHDLFEGTFARAGLVSDVEVIEDFPTRFDVASARHHRWARGDWQLLPWVLGRAPSRPGGEAAAPRDGVPPIGRWKMIDNLRRTLLPPVAFLGLVVGWSTLPAASALLWTLFVLSPFAVPAAVPVLASLRPLGSTASLRHRFRTLRADARLAAGQAMLVSTFLPHEAWSMADAIGRTLVRVLSTRRNLLEWLPAGRAARRGFPGPLGWYRAMAPSVALVVIATVLVATANPRSLPIALPLVLAWLLAPAVARCASLTPAGAGRPQVGGEDEHELRLIARRTWRYFETFVTDADSMLPPDNIQEDPEHLVAHRTSPTNIGLYLLSVVTARDFGWIGSTEMVERLEATLATMARMPRYRGHFFNWYDTRDLRVLDPPYVSSVDSGNLCAHLIATARACRDHVVRSAEPTAALAGMGDALALLRRHLQPEGGRAPSQPRHGAWYAPMPRDLDASLAALSVLLSERPVATATPTERLHAIEDAARAVVGALHQDGSEGGLHPDVRFWAEAVLATVASHLRDVDAWLAPRLEAVAVAARRYADEMDFSFLLSPERKLLSIGYLVSEASLDPSCYDLLASEARLASFVAIAKDDVVGKHWFRLGRGLAPVGRDAALVSWSGSMFEYLMPLLVMREPTGSLLAHTNRQVVAHHQRYGAERSVPWGISESAFNARDLHLNYQYSSFGVPDLGLKRGLDDHLVIAPYATALAAMVDPAAAVRNFDALTRAGGLGAHGYYEALDFTASRRPEGSAVAVVRAFMAHHQGMTIVALANTLLGGLMVKRFHAEPVVRATELVLQERVPRGVEATRHRRPTTAPAVRERHQAPPHVRRLHTPHDVAPQTHLLSNGRYTVMLTGSGSGFSGWDGLAVTRWREDPTRDDWGSYVYLRDVASGEVWSATYQPTGAEPDRFHAEFQEDRARFQRSDAGIATTLDVLVSPENDAEVRRVSVSNRSLRTREIEVTSYAELVLGSAAGDAAHPAFSKLFVTTELEPRTRALLATRRRRSPDEREVWAAHLCVLEGEAVGELEFETDRARFIGRGRSVRTAAAVRDGRPLTNTVGTVLDPVFSLRRRLRLAPGATSRLTFWTMVAPTREAALDLVDAHLDPSAFTRATTLAWTHAQVQLRHMRIDHADAALFQRLASHVLYTGPTLRPSSTVLRRARGGPEALWRHGISGDLPIVLLTIGGEGDLPLVRQLVRAHEYWSAKGLAVDLVILNEQATSYLQEFHAAIETLARAFAPRTPAYGGARGGIFVLRADQTDAATRALLPTVARAVLVGRRGPLADQLYRLRRRRPAPAGSEEPDLPVPVPAAAPALVVPPLRHDNGLGGFSADGREYVIRLTAGAVTPAPWANVVANPGFGFLVAAEGGGHTWALNARERHLTPWSNDPVSNPAGEAIYLRDEGTGALWCPTALPIRVDAPYLARHGFGYSSFEHVSHGIRSELLQFVPLADPVKVSRLRLRNLSATRRRLTVTGYVEWVLGPNRPSAAHHVQTAIDPATAAMLAWNPWHTAFGERTAFFDMGGRQTAFTGDRAEFVGRNRTLRHPLALDAAEPLSGSVGAGLDPCGALQTAIELAPGETVELRFLLGETGTAADAQALIRRYRAADVDALMADVRAHWDGVLGTVQVKTPDDALDVMLNGWLLYQALACRVWARAAFYQASGAFGFRDQLQDGMALAGTRPDLTREHLVRAAGRQFLEGDVQHWWLPHSGQGVRTRISDGRVWLAYALAQYLDVTGDLTVLDETVPFLEGPPLAPEEHEAFFEPATSGEFATVYEHAARALDRSLATGAHGLPLIGTGDWNDGMNRVGEQGRGESVWLGWFLATTLAAFMPIARGRGDDARSRRWQTHLDSLSASLDRGGWDGDWYRRAFFDDGTPLGSATSEACRIDAIAQSWAVISGMAPEERARAAMHEVDTQLFDRERGLMLLFTPPFDRTDLDPGYIKGYPPGLRENGGQYTHAALWNVIAFAELGDGDRAAELLATLNPVHRAATPEGMARYKVEPYVIAADVYAAPGHVGRGGWTWYTGSAAWMQRAGVESLLGLRRRGAALTIDPCIPRSWPLFEIRYRHGRDTTYRIVVENPGSSSRGVRLARLDGVEIAGRPVRFDLVDDGRAHEVHVVLG